MKGFRSVRIQNDSGHALATTVTDTETGEAITSVRSVAITIDVDDPVVRADLTVSLPVVDVVAEARISTECPMCGHVDEPEYVERMDGRRVAL